MIRLAPRYRTDYYGYARDIRTSACYMQQLTLHTVKSCLTMRYDGVACLMAAFAY
jgi:hypothetical protein